MGEILKFPGEATTLGYRRVRKQVRRADDPNQLDLFLPPPARIASFASGLSSFEQALLSDERGDDQAADLYAKAIENQDCVADALCNLGIIESKKGNAAKAFDCFTTSLKHDPRHIEAHYNLGNLYFELNDFQLAQLHYELAAEVDPMFANVYFNLLAQLHYELAAEVDPMFANVYFNLALVQSLNNELAAAVASLTKYQHLAPAAEGRQADDLLRNLRQTLAAKKGLGS
jgi:tetratricopeptide (TPR) repeat protein